LLKFVEPELMITNVLKTYPDDGILWRRKNEKFNRIFGFLMR